VVNDYNKGHGEQVAVPIILTINPLTKHKEESMYLPDWFLTLFGIVFIIFIIKVIINAGR